MFTVVGIMFAGILVGYVLRNVKFLEHVGKTVSWTILAMLLFLGIAVGLNDTVIDNLRTLGLQALLMAVLGTLGSVLAAWAVYHFFFKENKEEDK